MNRLVIIGNGFDLAHGLPTKYSDFIEDYFIDAMKIFAEKREFSDTLLTMRYRSSVSLSSIPELDSLDKVLNFFEVEKHYVVIVYHSHFFKSLTSKIGELNWVDVENEYFEALNGCRNKPNHFFDFEAVDKLNIEFDCIKRLLEKYLTKVVKNNINAINPNRYSKVFSDFIFKKEVLLKKLDGDILPNNIHILNFNYTSFIERSLDGIRDIPIDINYIHGILNYSENPIIFGFGDEFNKDYKDFEDQKNNSLFKHIKSFGYFKTTNYHDLIRFVESDDYQVYIVGHSCGLSDRIMLKEIFENVKCKSIKIFYYQKPDNTNDYVEKTMEISRHFEDKGLMRKKIVPFPLSNKM